MALAVLRGLAQIFLLESFVTGIFVLLAGACAHLTYALALAMGSFVGLCVGGLLGGSYASLYAGLWSYDAALAAVAIVALHPAPALHSWLLSAVAAALAPFFRAMMDLWGVPQLTLAFNFSALLVLYSVSKSERQREIELADPLPGPPHSLN